LSSSGRIEIRITSPAHKVSHFFPSVSLHPDNLMLLSEGDKSAAAGAAAAL
jgi:hypothetical protein